MIKSGFVVLLFLSIFSICSSPALQAGSKEEFQKYLNEMSAKVKMTADPAEKRAILNSTFSEVSRALTTVKGTVGLTDEDRAGIQTLERAVGDKHDELNGLNGFARVPDARLNAFAEYTVQDMEQAQQYVTISLVGLLLIVILVLLLARA